MKNIGKFLSVLLCGIIMFTPQMTNAEEITYNWATINEDVTLFKDKEFLETQHGMLMNQFLKDEYENAEDYIDALIEYEPVETTDNEIKIKQEETVYITDMTEDYIEVITEGGYKGYLKSDTDLTFFISEEKYENKFNLIERCELIKEAVQYEGNPYEWGGTDLLNGADCSGFVLSLYEKYDIELPRHSGDQAEIGKEVLFEELKPGDLIYYNRGERIGHVAIYLGNGYRIHAQSEATGIVIDKSNEIPVICRSVF